MLTKTFTMPKIEDDVVGLAGGLDQVTPTLKLGPGQCRYMLNFECALNGGYTRTAGHERFNGKISPSSARYHLLPLVNVSTVQVTEGAVITGAVSGTVGTAITTFPIGSTHFAVTLVSGSGYMEGEALTVGGVIRGILAAQIVTLTKRTKKQYMNFAADRYRTLISAVPGIGPVRGLFGYTDKTGDFAIYAVRDRDLGGSSGIQADFWKATADLGWTALPIHKSELQFTAAGPEPIPEGFIYNYFGQLVTINRVILQGGSWAANTAFGLLIVDVAGAFHPLQGPVYTIGPASFTSTFPAVSQRWNAGGQYEFVLGNFGGQLSTSRIYGCDGANRCFEFDGETIVPIATGIEQYPVTINGVFTATDRPSHIAVHQNALFVSIGSSIFHSGPGLPYDFTTISGGGEQPTSDTVTGFMVLPGVQASGSLAVFSRNHTKVLYGTALAGPEPFDLVNFETETGALPFTVQKLDRVYYLDDRGVIDIKAAQDYGNFTTATLTRFIQTWITQKAGRAACSMVNRVKSQYRIFFTDATALYLTIDNGKFRGASTMAFPVAFGCAWSGENDVGQELLFVGGTDGFVYQMERGTSFDGEPIDAELLLNWNTMNSPRVRKTLHRASIEIQDTDYTELRVGNRLGPEITAHLQEDAAELQTENELTMHWDHFTWDDFWWDAHAEAPLEVDVKGTAERVQYRFSSGTDYLDPYTVTSIVTPYLQRRRIR